MNSFKLLLVEDDPLLGEALFEALRGKGFKVRLAKSGAEALAAASDESFDLLLQDVRLPDVDGLDLLADLLQMHPTVHALVMTGQATVEMAVRAMKLGAFDFITKPFSVDVLLLKLERLLEYRGLENSWRRCLKTPQPPEPSLPAHGHAYHTGHHDHCCRQRGGAAAAGRNRTGRRLLAETIHSRAAERINRLSG